MRAGMGEMEACFLAAKIAAADEVEIKRSVPRGCQALPSIKTFYLLEAAEDSLRRAARFDLHHGIEKHARKIIPLRPCSVKARERFGRKPESAERHGDRLKALEGRACGTPSVGAHRDPYGVLSQSVLHQGRRRMRRSLRRCQSLSFSSRRLSTFLRPRARATSTFALPSSLK